MSGKHTVRRRRLRTQFAPKVIALAVSFYCASASGAITLTGDYIRIGTNDFGTIGSGGGTSPGILYDNTGTSTFNTAYDYLTPGTPFEGFTVRATAGGTTYNALTNNSGGIATAGLTGTLANASSGSYQGVTWTGAFTPAGGSKLFDIVNSVGFNTGEKRITITTTITAAQNLTDLYFARYTDPDAVAAAGDSSQTNNFRGNGSVPAANLVYAEALVSKYVIGLYSAASSGVNTGVSSGWSTDPTVYYAGTNNGNGDYTIGLTYFTATVNANGSITYTYYYIFGSDIAAAIAASVSSGSGTVLGSATQMGNQPAYGAAGVIDNTPALLALFSGETTDQARSQAASQTLPLLTGGSIGAAKAALAAVNRVIQARIDANLGMSSGDDFLGDRNVWMRPFGSRADQDDDNGVSGYKADTYGIAMGFDGTPSPALRIGGALAYAKVDANGNSSIARQNADVDVYQLVGYGSYSVNERTDINFQADIGRNNNEGRRQIAFTSTVAASDYKSDTAHVGIGIGRNYPLSVQTILTPSVRADYTYIKDKGYTESGAGLLNLTVGSRKAEAFVIGVDGKLTHKLNDQISLQAILGVGYDTMSDQDKITSSFAGAPTAAFVTYGIEPSPWLVRGGVGTVYKTKAGLEITGRYDAEYRESFLNQTASVKLRWAF